MINVRQRITVAQLGTSKPSLSGQCPHIKEGPDPIPIPTNSPPKRRTKICETEKIEKISNFAHPKYRKKATGKPQKTKPGPTPQRPTQCNQRTNKIHLKPYIKIRPSMPPYGITPVHQSRFTIFRMVPTPSPNRCGTRLLEGGEVETKPPFPLLQRSPGRL